MPKEITETIKKTVKKAEVKLPDVKINPRFIKQVIESYEANKRQGTSAAKTRGMVSGGGKKPWKQKGTGRARAGSSRSPIWKGGGVTFGPLAIQNFNKTIPTKMKLSVMNQLLKLLSDNKKINIVDEIIIKDHKTKNAISFLKSHDATGTKTLVVTNKSNPESVLAFSNIQFAKIMHVNQVSVLDIYRTDHLIIDKESYEILIKRITKETNEDA